MNKKFILENLYGPVASEAMLEDIRRVAHKHGMKFMTTRQYNELGKHHTSTIALRFGSWKEALRQAGLEASKII
jgi:Homing endonuclease associated repeat